VPPLVGRGMRFRLGRGVVPVVYLVKPHFRRRARYALSLDDVHSLAGSRRRISVVPGSPRCSEVKLGLHQAHELGQGQIINRVQSVDLGADRVPVLGHGGCVLVPSRFGFGF